MKSLIFFLAFLNSATCHRDQRKLNFAAIGCAHCLKSIGKLDGNMALKNEMLGVCEKDYPQISVVQPNFAREHCKATVLHLMKEARKVRNHGDPTVFCREAGICPSPGRLIDPIGAHQSSHAGGSGHSGHSSGPRRPSSPGRQIGHHGPTFTPPRPIRISNF